MNLCSWVVGQARTEMESSCNRFRKERKEKGSANAGDLPCYKQRLVEMKGEFLRLQLGLCSPVPGLSLSLGFWFQCCNGLVSFLVASM